MERVQMDSLLALSQPQEADRITYAHLMRVISPKATGF